MCKSCIDCPIEVKSDTGDMVGNLGCLPTYSDAIEWFNDTGKVWACHANPKKYCAGLVNIAKRYGVDVPIENIELITEQHTLEDIYA